jgi:hypothetical protein
MQQVMVLFFVKYQNDFFSSQGESALFFQKFFIGTLGGIAA